jgi:predicted AlkP superfamily phosphohydrolase/phosphomutase
VQSREQWDCFAFVLIESDFAGHRYWKYYDPGSPQYHPGAPEELRQGLPKVYSVIDDALGRIMAADPEAAVLIFSDHGFGGASTKTIFLNRFLEQQGLLKFAAGAAGAGSLAARLRLSGRLAASRLKDIGLHYMPERLRTPLLRSMKIGNQIESRIRFGGIDWRGTVVYSDESPYFPALWVNLAGRESGGIVPADKYEETCVRVARALESWRDPETGHPLVSRVHRREEIYRGEQVGRAPDLLIDWNHDNGYSYLSGRSLEDLSGQSVRRLAPDEFHSHEMATRGGSHRPNGLLMAARGPFNSDAVLQSASLSDLAPTVLFCQGLGIPQEMEGRVLSELFNPAFLSANIPQRLAAAVEPAAMTEAPADNYTDEEREIIERRLRDLGYL